VVVGLTCRDARFRRVRVGITRAEDGREEEAEMIPRRRETEEI
jgi:hypothetical protein